MKFLLLMIALLGLTGFAQAETINIQTTSGFGNLHQYHNADINVPDDPDLTVTLYLPQSTATGGMTLWFSDQVDPVNNRFYSYYVGTYNGNGLESHLDKCVFTEAGTCAKNGETLSITLHETSYRKQINSGRAHYWVTKWTLLDGLIVW